MSALDQWRAGAAQAPFPVPVGTPMAGYAARVGPSTGTLDALTIGALVLESEARWFVVVAADIAGVDTALVDEVAAAAGLERSALVLCASHTHSGPAGVTARLHPADDDRSNPALRAEFVRLAAEAIETARTRMEPVDLRFGQADTSGLAANRNAADGPFDPRVSVLAALNRSGQVIAALTHFACHPTILGAESRLISAEFPGVLRRELAIRLAGPGDPPVVLFANGAAGDVSTRFTRFGQDRTEVERVGTGVADAAMRALAVAEPVGPGIEVAAAQVELDARSLDREHGPMDDAIPGQESAAERRKAETRAQGAMLLERLTKQGADAVQRVFELPAWRLGRLRLVAVPGELFASLGAEILGSVPAPALVLGYANGYVGYLVDDAAEAAGTYEALASPFAPGSGAVVAAGAKAALGNLPAG